MRAIDPTYGDDDLVQSSSYGPLAGSESLHTQYKPPT